MDHELRSFIRGAHGNAEIGKEIGVTLESRLDPCQNLGFSGIFYFPAETGVSQHRSDSNTQSTMNGARLLEIKEEGRGKHLRFSVKR